MKVIRLSQLNIDSVMPLVVESEHSSWRFMRKFLNEWLDGTNRFDRPGEALLAAMDGEKIVGICGLNIDPYRADSTVGRLRRLYVLQSCRGRGLGRQLIQAAIAAARDTFRLLRVRTENQQAAQLYEKLGFAVVDNDENATHSLELTTSWQPAPQY
jgi:ribosomal protein S18 acetylase RimI-like enzyme